MSDVIRVALPDRSVSTVIDTIAHAVAAAGGGDAVGVGMPGFVFEGQVLRSPNFPEWHDVPLAARLAGRIGAPVVVDNDANLAAYGAWARRGGQESLVMLTLGTGVGGGFVFDGRPFVGGRGTAAEVGHLWIGGDRPCGCGARGCLETWVATHGLVAGARERGHDVADGRAVFAAAEAGEAWAVGVLADAAAALGHGLRTLANLLDPDVFVIAGGLAEPRWFGAAEAAFRAEAIAPAAARAQIVWEGRADDFAIHGAARWARQVQIGARAPA